MCLAVPAKVIEQDREQAVVDLQGNRLRVSTVLTPEVGVGDWVLVHAGFAITQLGEAEALETWDYLRQVLTDPLAEAGADAPPDPARLSPPEGSP
jgi:hydrogenase expression/formation protein HypC